MKKRDLYGDTKKHLALAFEQIWIAEKLNQKNKEEAENIRKLLAEMQELL